MVVVPKRDGQLRIRLDPRDMKRAVLREHYQLPSIEGISTRFTVNSIQVKKTQEHDPLSTLMLRPDNVQKVRDMTA